MDPSLERAKEQFLVPTLRVQIPFFEPEVRGKRREVRRALGAVLRQSSRNMDPSFERARRTRSRIGTLRDDRMGALTG
jgi:hypothetical protein